MPICGGVPWGGNPFWGGACVGASSWLVAVGGRLGTACVAGQSTRGCDGFDPARSRGSVSDRVRGESAVLVLGDLVMPEDNQSGAVEETPLGVASERLTGGGERWALSLILAMLRRHAAITTHPADEAVTELTGLLREEGGSDSGG